MWLHGIVVGKNMNPARYVVEVSTTTLSIQSFHVTKGSVLGI
jgi:hypothetical protein